MPSRPLLLLPHGSAGRRALSVAADLGAACGQLCVAHVVEEPGRWFDPCHVGPWAGPSGAAAGAELLAWARATAPGTLAVETVLIRDGADPTGAIVRAAIRRGCDVIVATCGCRRRWAPGRCLAHELIRSTTVPVLALGGEPRAGGGER